MPVGKGGFKYIINARDDITGFVVAEALRSYKSIYVSKFILKYICRFGLVGIIIADRAELNSETVVKLAEKYGIKIIFPTPFHPQSERVVEKGHQSFIKGLTHWLGEKNKGNWPEYLIFAIWPDNITIRKSTGFSPYSLMFGRDAYLPIEFEYLTWNVDDSNYPMSREVLIVNRIEQLCKVNENTERAIENVRQSRLKGKYYFDNRHNIRNKEIEEGDMVLLFDSAFEMIKFGRKFSNRWIGPYMIKERYNNGSFKLMELDGTEFKTNTHGNRLKLFKERAFNNKVPGECKEENKLIIDPDLESYMETYVMTDDKKIDNQY